MTKRSRDEQRAFLRDLVMTMVKAVVANEDSVECRELAGEHNIVLEVYVDEGDVGLALGAGGSHAQAMRTLVQVACKKTDFKYNIDIINRARRRRG